MKTNSVIYILLLAALGCAPKKQHRISSSAPADKMQAIVFSSEHGGFGYNIFVNDVLVIHQPHVPVVRGMQGFASHKEAQDVAALVIKKMKSGVIPPVITLEEMQTLSVRL